MNISIYKNRYGTSPEKETDLLQYLEDVKGGLWQDLVMNVRRGKANKEDAPGVTVSGAFKGKRRLSEPHTHSGFIGIDLDAQDNPELLDKKDSLAEDPYCFALHTSIRGGGLVFYVKIHKERHKDAFYAIEKYLSDTYEVTVDPSGKDVTRLRFVSHDPDLRLNERSKKWTQYIPKKQDERIGAPKLTAFHDEDIKYIMEQIAGGINLAESYSDWVKMGFALAGEFGEQGRGYYHTISSQSAKYNQSKTDRQYDISLARDERGVSMSSFFWLCNNAGIETTSPLTKEIVTVFKQRAKSYEDRTQAIDSTKEYFERMENLKGDRVDKILDQVKDVSLKVLKEEKADDKALELETFVKSLGLRFNTITRRTELEREPLTDRDYNSIYRRCAKAIGLETNKNKLCDLIESDITPEYNPFLEFFETHKDVKSEGHIEELLACIEYEKPYVAPGELTEEEESSDYLEVFLTRWLVSIVSSMHGTYSLLVLVFTGSQGTGKSKFFRHLLPEELLPYYGESKLDKDKDDGILMCQKIILLDDEFSGKSKREASKFKEISSRETFTVRKPYGRTFEELRRIAVLCGTTNDLEILNDATGNRRLVPVNITSIDIKRYEAIDKVALFMEIYRLWKEIGDGWMLGPKEIAYLNKSTVENEDETIEEGLIMKYLSPSEKGEPRAEFMTVTDVFMLLEERTSTRIMIKKIRPLMKKLGFKWDRPYINGVQGRGYWVRSHVEITPQPRNGADF